MTHGAARRCLLTLLVLLGPPAYSQDFAESLDALRRGAEGAMRDARRYGEWQRRFASLTTAEVASLISDDNDSIALMAAWETHVLRPSLALPALPNGIHPIPAEGCARFVAFCEGRLRFRLPPWFELALRAGKTASEPGERRDFVVASHMPLLGREIVRRRVMTHHPADELRVEGEDLHLVGESEVFVLPTERLEELGEIKVAFASEKDRFWIAEYVAVQRSFSLALHTVAGDRRWKATVWPMVYAGASSGPLENRAEILRHGELVTVVGVGSLGAYINSFDAMSGRPLLRFVTTVVDPLP